MLEGVSFRRSLKWLQAVVKVTTCDALNIIQVELDIMTIFLHLTYANQAKRGKFGQIAKQLEELAIETPIKRSEKETRSLRQYKIKANFHKSATQTKKHNENP